MSDRYEVFRWDRVRGECLTEPPASLPDYLAAELYDSELTGQQALLKKRPVTTAISLTGGPSAEVQYLYTFVTTTGVSELWSFSRNTGDAPVAHRHVSGTWSSVSLTDTAAVNQNPMCATLNGKLFIAYGSGANRLHLWDGTSVRRVGIEASAAPSVANTGSGSYAATLRYYKVQFKIKSGSNTIATSELSASQSFTPSGSGTAARVTKPTTPDSATHWRVFGSEDNVTFYELGSSDIVVATTTFDDSVAPADYSSGAVAPTAGLNVPPPSALFLTTDGNRLLMAGMGSSSGTSTQTSPRASRVWFTAVLGARDNTGEDESIPQTIDQKNWIDVGEGDGDIILGLSQPIAGLIYVFKGRSIWMLIPTGSPTTPYRSEKVLDGVGVNGAYAIDTGEIALGQPAVYFMGSTGGPYRISPSRGLEWLGRDWWTLPESPSAWGVRWWPTRRQVWFMGSSSTAHVLTPDLMERDGQYLRGGWGRYRVSIGTGGVSASTFRASAIVTNQLFMGGSVSTTTAAICSVGSGTQDAGSVDVNPTATSKAYLLAQNGRKKLSAENPIVETFEDQTTTVGYIVDYGTARSGSYTDQGGSGRTTQKIEDVWAVDGRALQIQVTLSDAAAADVVEAVTVPFKEAQAL